MAKNSWSSLSGTVPTGIPLTRERVPRHMAAVRLDPAFPFDAFRGYFHNPHMQWFHVHDVWEIGLCEEGEGIFAIEDKMLPFRQGDVFLIGPQEFHHAYHPGGGAARWVFLSADLARLLGGLVSDHGLLDPLAHAGPSFCNRFRREETPEIHEVVRRLVAEAFGRGAGRRDMVRALLLEFLVTVRRTRRGDGGGHPVRARAPEEMLAVAPALNLMAERFATPLTVPALAAACRMSESHFRRRFLAVMGRGPLEHLLRLRIQHAAHSLQSTDKPVAEIALDCGFGSLSSFNRQFRKLRRCSPREYRNGR